MSCSVFFTVVSYLCQCLLVSLSMPLYLLRLAPILKRTANSTRAKLATKSMYPAPLRYCLDGRKASIEKQNPISAGTRLWCESFDFIADPFGDPQTLCSLSSRSLTRAEINWKTLDNNWLIVSLQTTDFGMRLFLVLLGPKYSVWLADNAPTTHRISE